MQNSTYLDLSQWYANRCPHCHGKQYIEIQGSPRRCICQKTATARARLEAVDIVPENLKYMQWKDFTGLIRNDDEIKGSLTTTSATEGRNAAFRYCYDKDFDLSLTKNPSNLVLSNRLRDGKNVIITGPQNSGKSLLGVLILREACRSYIIGKNFQFRWVKFYDIINHARWNAKDKEINHVLLDEYAELDFLFIDGVDMHLGGHNSPPDHVAMNVLFGTRRSFHLPTIYICSNVFMQSAKRNIDNTVTLFGQEFGSSISDPKNTVIELKKA